MEYGEINNNMTAICSFFQNLMSIPIQTLDCDKEIEIFYKKYCFSSIQCYLHPEQICGLLANVAQRNILHVIDQFRLNFLFFRLNGSLLAIGPYCTDVHSVVDATLLFRRLHLNTELIPDYIAYRSQFSVINAETVKRAAFSLIRFLDPDADEYATTDLSYGQGAYDSPYYEESVQLPYSTLISNRYAIELQMMDYVTAGNATAAIENLRIMLQSVAFLTRRGNTLENARIGAAITRTCARLAASRAGLSAWLVDRISNKNTEQVFSTNSIEEIHFLQEEVIREYCYNINQLKDSHYSPLVLSALYYLRRNYFTSCTLTQVAAELDVPVNTLSARFRKETGQALGAMLNTIRMRHAARMLAGSSTPIQRIAEAVGILDANYFIKVFKKEYSMTPGQYRSSHQI